MSANPWASVPKAQRSIVRCYLNSEREEDYERAMVFCRLYGLDYAAMRRLILDELIAQSRELGKAWYPAAGSRPLSEERKDADRL